MLVFLVYLGELIGTVSNLLMTAIFICAVIAIATFIATADAVSSYGVEHDDKVSICKTWYGEFRKFVNTTLVIVLMFIFIPSQKTFYIMVAAYAGTVAIESPEAKRIFDKAVSALERKLDEYSDVNKTKTEVKK